MDTVVPGSGRRSRAALKDLLLEAATEVLRRDGVGIETTTITYQRVFDHLEATQGIRITRGSVHERIWTSQRDFELDVLRRVASWSPTESTASTTTAVLANADLSTDDGRWRTIQDIWRRVGPAYLTSAEERDHWSSWIGIALALSGNHDDDSDERRALLDTVAETYRRASDELIEMSAGAFEAVGARPRADLVPPGVDASRLVTMLATALADGVALRQQFADDVDEVELATGPDGALETWNPFNIGIWAINRYFSELEENPSAH